MALAMSAEDVAAAAARKTVPATERQPQTLEVETKGTPPTPEVVKPGPDLQKKVQELEAEKAELLKGNKAKDKAIEDLKRPAPQVPPEAPGEDEDALEQMKKSVSQEILDALSKKQDQQTSQIKEGLQPFLEEAATIRKERQEQAAVKAVGQAAFDEHKAAGYEMQEKHPTLSLTEALRLVVPAGTAVPQTAPQTEVQASRAPAPQVQKTAAETYTDLLAGASALTKAGQHSKADAAFTEAVKTRVPEFVKMMKDKG